MREIKVIGKSIYSDEWLIGHLVKIEDSRFAVLPDINEIETGKSISMYEVYSETVGQYTGMKDRNGREIYEGDIINWLSFGMNRQGFVEQGMVEFRTDEMAYIVVNRISTMDNRESIQNLIRCTRDLTVFGNIHDNPKLMK